MSIKQVFAKGSVEKEITIVEEEENTSIKLKKEKVTRKRNVLSCKRKVFFVLSCKRKVVFTKKYRV